MLNLSKTINNRFYISYINELKGGVEELNNGQNKTSVPCRAAVRPIKDLFRQYRVRAALRVRVF